MIDLPGLATALVVGAVMVVATVLAWTATGPRGRPLDPTTPGRMFVLLYLLSTGLGGLVITASGETVGWGAAVGAVGLLAFGAGAWIAARRGEATPLDPPAETGAIRLPALVGLALVGVAGYASIAIQDGIPLLTADAIASRAAYGGIAFDLFRWLAGPAFLVTLALALARPTVTRWAAAAATFAVVAGLEILAGSRALPAELILAGLLLAWWAGRRLPRRVWLALAVVGLIGFAGLQLVRSGSRASFRDVGDFGSTTVARTVERVVLVQARTLDLIVTEIPHQQPYYLGSTYVRWLAPLRGQATPEPLGSWLFREQFPGQPQGFVTPGFIGELWANGGAVLVLLGMALFGAALQWLGRAIGRFDRGAADRVLAALLVVAAGRAYATSLNGLLLTLVVAVMWRLAVAGPDPLAWGRRVLGLRDSTSMLPEPTPVPADTTKGAPSA